MPFFVPYAQLYAEVQTQSGKISTHWLKEEAIRLSEINRIREQWSSIIDHTAIRGFYVEGPMGPPVPLGDQESLIVLSREMCVGPYGKQWRRFVFTKELMHVFDEASEKAGSRATFDIQIEKFQNPAAEMSAQFRAELKASWRALGVLCSESDRRMYREMLSRSEISMEVLATKLVIPENHVRNLMRDDFERVINGLM